MAHPLFYDAPYRGTEGGHFPAARRPLPRGWKRIPRGDWIGFIPPDPVMPDQGWKIHVSACQDNVSDTLTTVWKFCVAREIPFKIAGSPRGALIRNMKYAERSSAGKMAAIYPADEAAFERILRELDAELRGAAGPYILSDVRYAEGPLYARYGGFIERFCTDSDGQPTLAIENPAGDLVPDVRSPVFSVPDWVTLPEFLRPHLAARNSVGFSDIDYTVTGALHFSNGGGVYTATDKRDGRKVILKEARPHAGLAGDGSDAVTRLRREYEIMRRLAGLGVAAEVYDCFQVGDHHFLAEEFIDGKTFHKCVAQRYPILTPDPDPGELAEFTEWVLRTCSDTEHATELMHSRDVVFRDLHPHNVILRPDSSVVFIDFETAGDVSQDTSAGLGNPGFIAPADRTGFEIDAYALACIRLSAFIPLTAVLPLDRTKAEQIAAAIAALFPVPDSFLAEAIAEIGRGAPPPERTADSVTREFAEASRARTVTRAAIQVVTRAATRSVTQAVIDVPRQADQPGDPAGGRPGNGTAIMGSTVTGSTVTGTAGTGSAAWTRLSRDLVAAIEASATPDRTDRLFPGDVEQFSGPGGGLGLAYGAAGVLFALDEAVGVRVPRYQEWLLRQVRNAPADMPLGCWNGLSGIAWALGRLGHAADAARLVDRCLSADWERLRPDFFDGLSGFGLALLELADMGLADTGLADTGLEDTGLEDTAGLGSTAVVDAGLKAADIVADFLRHDDSDTAGLMHGKAGRALLLIRAYERTGSPGYLDAARTAIADDLDRCLLDRDGGLQVDEGYRSMPYLADGSAGIGLVIDRYLAHRDNPDLARAAERIATAASSTFYIHSGLFTGRAGLLCFLAAREGADLRISDHVARLAWYAMPYSGGLAFPGDQLLRLSMDLGTGTAGVLLGLASALAPHGAAVPFLARPESLPERAPAQAGPAQGAGQDREPAGR